MDKWLWTEGTEGEYHRGIVITHMSTFTKKITSSLAVAIVVGVSVLLFATMWLQKAIAFVAHGMEDGKNIRVAERNTCVITSNEAYFTGCNSIL